MNEVSNEERMESLKKYLQLFLDAGRLDTAHIVFKRHFRDAVKKCGGVKSRFYIDEEIQGLITVAFIVFSSKGGETLTKEVYSEFSDETLIGHGMIGPEPV